MKFIFLTALAVLLAFKVSSQCLTDFKKIHPEPTIDNTLEFGRSVAMYDNYLAIGIPNSDSLGRITGIVHMYEKIESRWKKIATIMPQIPSDALQFGWSLKMSQDYLLVGATGNGGKVYLFQKPSSGWGASEYYTENLIFRVDNSFSFGVSNNNTLAISDDQLTIAITDQNFQAVTTPAYYRTGAVFVYRRQFDGWNPNQYTRIIAPEDDVADFGRGSVGIQGDRIAIGSPFSPTGNGTIYVYRDLDNPVLEARLSSGTLGDSNMMGFYNFVFTSEGIFASASVFNEARSEFRIIYFQTPATGTWTDRYRTCDFDPDADATYKNTLPLMLATNGEDIFVSSRDSVGNGSFNYLRKGVAGWCNPQRELIENYPRPLGPVATNYGLTIASNQNTNAAIGFVGHPDAEIFQLSLKIFSRNADGTWESQLIYPDKKSTAGHWFGGKLLRYNEYLFVSAPYDGSTKPDAGAVYCYVKRSDEWQKTIKIPAPLGGTYDDVFGTDLACNGKHLAVAASGYEPYGKVFIYEKTDTDWSDVELIQEIQLPDSLDVNVSCNYIAMDHDWLVISYNKDMNAEKRIAIYKFNGTSWSFRQDERVEAGIVLNKGATIDVDIENGVMVAGGHIFELDANETWRKTSVLSTTDPESYRFGGYPNIRLLSNGSEFGQSVDIDGNTIFIGAPWKDYNDLWDVGAVYVYTKKPGETWSSRKETAKILPRVKEERELFGHSIKGLHNTLIVGAVGADRNLNGTARTKPGRAYIFQSQDYFWNDVIALVDFTGDTFVKDYYGMGVELDQSEFFISAPIEDSDDAKLSGAVYITPTPPIIKLVPPVCSSEETIDLFGYPFNGTWSGPGLINEQEGIFDPRIAGIGIHDFTYETESCTYLGRLKIQVEEPPKALLGVDTNQTVCTNGAVYIPISVQQEADVVYEWYYREKPENEFTTLNIFSSSMTATKRGEYQAKVSTQACESHSPVVSVLDEYVDVTLVPPNLRCEKSEETVLLEAQPSGGKWSGQGVINNSFVPGNLSPGTYPLTYKYTSTKGCVYQKETSAEIVAAFTPSIQRLSGNLCENGEVTLGVNGAPASDIKFNWQFREQGASSFSDIYNDEPTLTLSQHGTYQVITSNGVCTRTSIPLSIDDRLQISVLPENNEIEICTGEEFTFTVKEHNPENMYTWLLSEDGESEGAVISEAYVFSPASSGYYHAVVKRGVCEAATGIKHLIIHPADSIFIPNVFTPNGDGNNDQFEVWTTLNDVQINLWNRYGQSILQFDASSGWTGDGFPSGTYYWQVRYSTCLGERKIRKGYVQLLR